MSKCPTFCVLMPLLQTTFCRAWHTVSEHSGFAAVPAAVKHKGGLAQGAHRNWSGRARPPALCATPASDC